MTTGTIPNFVDIIYNLGSNSITEDNILHQAEYNGKSIIFYGDETWLKLFPRNFKRKEGTKSFFVSDFTEVDNNVSRHLDKELKENDWNIMILHYLGLDHIGHLEGPKSAFVHPKLIEMDNVVRKIYNNMVLRDENSSQISLLIICGDHGMKDSGGHGGATIAETTVPIIAVGLEKHSINLTNKNIMVSQIDLVPTLSVLLGIPIPKGNIGKLIPQFMQNIPQKVKLFAYYYNAKQITKHKEMDWFKSKEGYFQYEEAVRLHTLWLKSNYQIAHYADKAEELYKVSLEKMSESLGNSRIRHDLLCLIISICICLQVRSISIYEVRAQNFIFRKNMYFFQVCLILFCEISVKNCSSKISKICLFSISFAFLNTFYCVISKSESELCTFSMECLLKTMVPIIVIFDVNFVIISHLLIRWPKNSDNLIWKFFLIGSTLHLISFGSSSFIEEEHQVWYFLWLTFIIVVFWKQCQECYHEGCFKNMILYSSIVLAISHRTLRKFNQTGDKWASLPDISDWLLQPTNKGYLSFIFTLGLFGNSIFMCHLYWKYSVSRAFKMLDIILQFSAVICIYLYRATTDSVFKLYNEYNSKGIAEVKVFWIILTIIVFKCCIQLLLMKPLSKILIIGIVMNVCCGLWMLISSLLHRPQNSLLPCSQACASLFLGSLYKKTLKTKDDTRWLAISHCWLGMVFYFYQGNSNNLATIDVASGYVGLEDYNPILVCLFLVINTFSAPIFSFLHLISQLTSEAKYRGVIWLWEHSKVAFHALISYRMYTITFYMILVMLQRYHLFVWTVFTPKLLYESVYTLVQFVFIFLFYGALFVVEKFFTCIF